MVNDRGVEGALESLGILARQTCEVAPGLSHVEAYTASGLLTLLWHGDPTAPRAAIMVGGAMGGLLGPAGGLYHRLGTALAAEGWQAIRVGYRRPNRLEECVHDTLAAAELAWAGGARTFALLGHSFGGAVAIGAAVGLGHRAAGVLTFATQSAGCEVAEMLDPRTRLLLLHGERDEILPVEASLAVRMLAGRGTVEVVSGAGHIFADLGNALVERTTAFLREAAPPPD